MVEISTVRGIGVSNSNESVVVAVASVLIGWNEVVVLLRTLIGKVSKARDIKIVVRVIILHLKLSFSNSHLLLMD